MPLFAPHFAIPQIHSDIDLQCYELGWLDVLVNRDYSIRVMLAPSPGFSSIVVYGSLSTALVHGVLRTELCPRGLVHESTRDVSGAPRKLSQRARVIARRKNVISRCKPAEEYLLSLLLYSTVVIALIDMLNECLAHKQTSFAFSPDSQRLASGSYNRTLKLWDPTTPPA